MKGQISLTSQCECARQLDFKPEGICGEFREWDYDQWKCVGKKTCSGECEYGKIFDVEECECVREDWCPIYRDDCSDSKTWDNEQCKCMSGEEIADCPAGKKYNKRTGKCEFTKAGCKLTDCPQIKQGRWSDGKCSC